MKPFALDNVLKHRQRLEDQARSKFQEASSIAEAVRSRYEETENELAQILEEIDRRQKEGIDITMFILYQDQVERLEKNIVAIRKNLTEKENLKKQMQEIFLVKTQERQAMERLKEEKNRAYRRYLEKKETMMLDEIAIIRYQADNT